MPKHQKKSAIFVDFDNIFITLNEQDPEAAQAFATQPGRWMDWLETFRLDNFKEGDQPRRILTRMCYLNPSSFQEFRPYFIKAAFRVVDCPPLTRRQKTATDIHLVMDVIETLNHPTEFDEFIILSGDADFTPLLIKLREHDKQTMVLSMGFSSPSYRAAASYVFNPEGFLKDSLGIHQERPAEPETRESRTQEQTEDIIRKAEQLVRSRIAEAKTAVPFPSLADHLQTNLGTKEQDGADWFGYDRFSSFLGRLDLDPLVIARGGPGYVYDSARHECPSDALENPFTDSHQELHALALKVHLFTETPLLAPEDYRALFEIIADEINANGFSLTPTSKAVRDAMLDKGIHIGRNQVNFVLIGIRNSGFDFSGASHEPMNLATTFARNVNRLCEIAQFQMDAEQHKQMLSWLVMK